MHSFKLSYVLFVFLLFGLSSCASYKSGAIDAKGIDEFSMRTTKEGIAFAADPYDSTDKAKEGFYVDVTSKSYYPVNLIFDNSTNGQILVLKETVELFDGSGNTYRPVRSLAMYEEFEKSKMAYALLGFGIFSYMSAEDANKKMEADWREKEMPNEFIVLAGRKKSGFVYFQLPKGKSTKGCKLKLEAEKLDSKEKVQMELTLL